ncbi:MAG: hypothetical protein LBN02_05320 [Oscillospiraceae bacterium]|jgi:hypothetical protein|nr:hypothetical protein [Oscillospiraceae bacterium]
MKKLPVLILVLALTLAACNTPTVEPVPSPSPTPTQPSPTPTPTIGAYLPDIPREFPDEPYTLGEIGTQYYGAPQYEYTPSADYGAIVPYIGGLSKPARHSPEGLEGVLVGFATLDGRVICEPVFSDCQVLSLGGDTAYIARRLRYVNGENVREDYVITASGSRIERYDEVRTTFYIYAEFFGETDDANEYITVRRGEKWGLIDLAGGEVLPTTSDFEIEVFSSPDGDVFLMTEISDTRVDYVFDPEYGDHEITISVPETIAHYFVNASGNRVTQSEFAVYAENESLLLESVEYRDGVLQFYSFGYTVPDGFEREYNDDIAAHDLSIALWFYENPRPDAGGVRTVNFLNCRDVTPPFIVYVAAKYAETRLPDGTVIVRRSLLGAQFD